MYLLTWNSLDSRIEASFGGHVSPDEAKRFEADLKAFLSNTQGGGFRVLLDYSTVHSISKRAEKHLDDSREACHEFGAEKVTFVTGDQESAEFKTSQRMQHVLEGTEQYLPYQRVH